MSSQYVVPTTDQSSSSTSRETEPSDSYVKDFIGQDFTFDQGEAVDESSTQVSRENRLNIARLSSYKKQFSQQLLEAIRESEFEFGYDSAVDVFLRARLAENALATKEWVNSLFIENFADTQTAVGILRVIAHLEYQEIAPQGPTIALAALSHSSLEVRECGIRAFENWGNLECLQILKSLSCPEKWMQDYVRQVVLDLEALLSVPAS